MPNSAGPESEPRCQLRAISRVPARDSPSLAGQVVADKSAVISKEEGVRNGARQCIPLRYEVSAEQNPTSGIRNSPNGVTNSLRFWSRYTVRAREIRALTGYDFTWSKKLFFTVKPTCVLF